MYGICTTDGEIKFCYAENAELLKGLSFKCCVVQCFVGFCML